MSRSRVLISVPTVLVSLVVVGWVFGAIGETRSGATEGLAATRPVGHDPGPRSAPVGSPEPVTVTTEGGVTLAVETVVGGLDTPWDLAWAPDGAMWMTERPGRISRIDVESGERTVVGELPDVFERGESGLMGMAFHPDFPTEPWVYAVYSYSTGSGRRDIGNRLVRMRYDGGRLGPGETLLDGMPGNSNHDGSRIVFGPDGMLYVTMGEAGNRPLAQDLGSLGGKILRLTPEGEPAPGNPFNSAVWSYGHRNPQGLVFAPGTDVLYSAEHGPSTDDEVNRIVAGGNYGWPTVAGYCDEPDEEAFCAAHDVVEPLHSFTPTVGIAAIDVYDSDAIEGWKGSLLVTSLGFQTRGPGRGATLFRIELNAAGTRSAYVESLFVQEFGRLRDVLVGPNGEFYLATSNQDGRGRPAVDDDRILRVTGPIGGSG